MEEAFIQMIHQNIPPNRFIFSSLVLGYGKAGKLNKVEDLFEKMEDRNVVLYNTLMDYYSKLEPPNIEAMDSLMEIMKADGFSPNEVTFMILIRAYVDKFVPMAKVEQLLEEMKDRELYIQNNLYCTALHGYARQGDIDNMEKKYSLLRNRNFLPNHITYNVMVSAYVKIGDIAKVRQMLDEMSKLGVKADVATYSLLIRRYYDLGDKENLKKTFEEMEAKELIPQSTRICCQEKRYSQCNQDKGT